MGDYALNVELRTETGKGVARQLRMKGRIPGVCYGKRNQATSVSLDPRMLERLISQSAAGVNTLIDLVVDGGGGDLDGIVVMVREIQRHPVKRDPIHADLFIPDLHERVTVSVPLHLTGKAPGVEEGGIVDHALRELEIQCLPTAIPREINVDIGALEVGHSVHVRDLTLPEGVELLSDTELSIVSVVAPVVEAVAPTEEEEAEAVEGEGAEAAPAEDGAADKETAEPAEGG